MCIFFKCVFSFRKVKIIFQAFRPFCNHPLIKSILINNGNELRKKQVVKMGRWANYKWQKATKKVTECKVMFKSSPAMEKITTAKRCESKALSNRLRLRQNLTSYGRTAAERATLCQGETGQQTGLWIVSALEQAWCTNDTMSTHKAWFMKEKEASLSPLLPLGIQGRQWGCREAQSRSHCGVDATEPWHCKSACVITL